MAERAPVPTPQLDPGSRRWALVAAAACLLPLLLQLPAALSITIAAAAVLVAALSLRRPMHGLLRAVFAVGLAVITVGLTIMIVLPLVGR